MCIGCVGYACGCVWCVTHERSMTRGDTRGLVCEFVCVCNRAHTHSIQVTPHPLPSSLNASEEGVGLGREEGRK